MAQLLCGVMAQTRLRTLGSWRIAVARRDQRLVVPGAVLGESCGRLLVALSNLLVRPGPARQGLLGYSINLHYANNFGSPGITDSTAGL
jgi:hypothetical protein